MTVVPGWGNRKAKILVLGEAPASNEVREGKPFVGKAGQEAHKLFGSVGLDFDLDVYRTNASLEPVTGDKDKFFFESNGAPSQHLLRGLAALMQDINEIRPNVVVPMGNYALWAMRQHMDIMRWRGSIIPSKVFQVKCVPTIHPAALLWSNVEEGGSGLYKYRPVIIWDLERVRHESTFPDIRLRKRTYLVEPTGAAREEALDRLRNAKKITFDCEGLYNRIGLKCISFSDYDPEWSVCFWNTGSQAMALFGELLETGVPKVGQNLMYDATLLDQLGIHVGNVAHDTMLGQHVIFPDLPKGLDFLASVNTDIPYYKDEGKTWDDKQPKEKLMSYCCKDNCATTETAIEQETWFVADRDLAATFRRSMLIFDPLRGITYHGVKVNTDVLNGLIKTTEEKRDKAQAIVNELAGYEVNVKSAPQVRNLVYEERGLPTPRSGKKTTQANILMDIAARTDDPLLVNIIRTRKPRTMLSNYYRYDILSPDGRLRWEYKIAGTKSGRLSCQIPTWGPGVNGQTLPAPARRMLEADDGWEFCEVDGMQAESVVTAVYAQDPVHLDCFRTGKDVHRVTAAMLTGVDPEKWADIPKGSKVRELGKTCNHAFDYDMGWYTFMLTVNEEWDPDDPESLRLNEKLAKALRNKYLEIRPALVGYWEWVRGQLRKDLTLRNVFGRKRTFLEKWSDTMHKDAYSWLPQGTIGDYTNIGIIQVGYQLRRMGIPHRLVAQTHDSAAWTYPKECRGEVVPVLLAHSEVPLHINGMLFTVPVEAAVGDSLYKLKPKDPENWKGLRGAGQSRKVIDIPADEYQKMLDRMNTALAA